MTVQRATSAPRFGFPRRVRRTRAWGAFAIIAAMAVMGVAAWLTPSPNGYGTHEELGLPPCGFLMVTGIPCPTCGMTTSFAQMAHGQIAEAVRTQPFGAALAVVVIVVGVYGVRTVVTGRGPTLRAEQCVTWQTLTAGVLFFLSAWAWKIVDHLWWTAGR